MLCRIDPPQGPLMFPPDSPFGGEYHADQVYDLPEVPPGFVAIDEEVNP